MQKHASTTRTSTFLSGLVKCFETPQFDLDVVEGLFLFRSLTLVDLDIGMKGGQGQLWLALAFLTLEQIPHIPLLVLQGTKLYPCNLHVPSPLRSSQVESS